MDIQPGSTVRITVRSRPKSQAACKTLARVFLQDHQIRKSRGQDPKPAKAKRRGGRMWVHYQRGSAAVVPQIGDSADVLATVDVIRDIQSVAQCLDVTSPN